jgi:hypothetical protein
MKNEKRYHGIRGEYALITGATSGIGYELAKLFAVDGYNLILVARSQERLVKVAHEFSSLFNVEAIPLTMDLFKPTAAQEIYNEVKARGLVVNVLVNDAGQGQWGNFSDTPLQRDIDIIQLNVATVVAMTKLFLRDMLEAGAGKILQVASEAGTAPIPLLSIYSATKAFVISFSAALANELKESGITITTLLPGATDTDFFHKACQDETVGYREERLASPAQVAQDGYRGLMRGEGMVTSGSKTKLHVFLNDLLGTKLGAAANRRLMEPSEQLSAPKWPGHVPSAEEREQILRETGRKQGDYNGRRY